MVLVEAAEVEQRDRAAVAAVIAALAARYGNRLATSQALREQHGHTTTWIENQPPDAVVFPQSAEEVQEIVRLCAAHRVPVIGYGTGTSLEGQVNAPRGGICLDFRDMNRVLTVHAEDLDCVIEPGPKSVPNRIVLSSKYAMSDLATGSMKPSAMKCFVC